MAENQNTTTVEETTAVADIPKFEDVDLMNVSTEPVSSGSRKGVKALVVGGIGLAVGGVCFLIHKKRKAKKAAMAEADYDDDEFEDVFEEVETEEPAAPKIPEKEQVTDDEEPKKTRKPSAKKEEKDA